MGREALVRDHLRTLERFPDNMDIFEGTEQIQQLVISRAISGLRIEWLTMRGTDAVTTA